MRRIAGSSLPASPLLARALVLAAVLALLAALPTLGETRLRVRLFAIQSPQRVTVHRDSRSSLQGCPGCPARSALPIEARAGRLYAAGADVPGGTLEVTGEYRVEGAGASFDAAFPLAIRAEGDRLLLEAAMPLETYTAAVLAGEVNTLHSEEARKAIAVVARTFALRFRGRHQSEGYDLCDTTHCQDLRLAAVGPAAEQAARVTAGELLWFDGTLAAAYHHQDCGGRRESAALVWADAGAPYLRALEDPYCVRAGGGQWRSELARADFLEALGARTTPAAAIRVLRRHPSGRVAELTLGDGPPWEAAAVRFAIGRALGWRYLPSDLWELEQRGDRLIFRGRGSGHGAGLCQTGAGRLGREGAGYREILAFYFPGTSIGPSATGLAWRTYGGERLEVLATADGAGRRVAAIADRALETAEARTGWRFAARPRIRVYPSVAAFRDATGEPGWVAASTRGREIRLQPAETLNRQQVLAPTLVHEFIHLLVEERAHPRLPLWFREGLVLHLSDPQAPPADPGAFRAIDRLEAALRQPPSELELRRAYAAARTLVQQLERSHSLAAILRWVEAGLPPNIP